MTVVKPGDVDELIRWMGARGATNGEIAHALREAGHRCGKTWVSARATSMGVSLARRSSGRARVTAWPWPRGVFTLRPARVTELLHRLAESADEPGGLTESEYALAKARILGGES